MTLRVGFAGTPPFAATALRAIVRAEFIVPLILTRPDKPKGRGMKVESSAVKQEATARELPILQPLSLRSGSERERALAYPLDVLVVAAYGLILPPDVLKWPRYGCLNIHASLLPRWRGAAPIQRAIEAGDRSSGVTIMQMDAGLDTGPMIAAREVAIDPRETSGTLHDKLARLGALAIVEVLGRLARDASLAATPQPEDGVTYAAKVARTEARIDWTAESAVVDRRIRAFDPAPGAYTYLDGELLKVWTAIPVTADRSAPPGTVLGTSAAGIDVACGAGALRMSEVQGAGGKRMPVAAFLAGRPLAAGMRFDPPEPEIARSGAA